MNQSGIQQHPQPEPDCVNPDERHRACEICDGICDAATERARLGYLALHINDSRRVLPDNLALRYRFATHYLESNLQNLNQIINSYAACKVAEIAFERTKCVFIQCNLAILGNGFGRICGIFIRARMKRPGWLPRVLAL
jgi:hypothetical protein